MCENQPSLCVSCASTTRSSSLASGCEFYIMFPLAVTCEVRSHLCRCSLVYSLVSNPRIETSWIPVMCSSSRKIDKAVENRCGLLSSQCEEGHPLCSCRACIVAACLAYVSWKSDDITPVFWLPKRRKGTAPGFLRQFPFSGFEKPLLSDPWWAHLLREERLCICFLIFHPLCFQVWVISFISQVLSVVRWSI